MPTFSLTLQEERSSICGVSFLCLIYDRRKNRNLFMSTTCTLPWKWQYAAINFPGLKLKMHLRIQFWQTIKKNNEWKRDKPIALVNHFTRQEKLQISYLVPEIWSLRAQMAVNSLLSTVWSLFKSNT